MGGLLPMPAKEERCVKEVMSKQGVSEERAWAICKSAINDRFIADRLPPGKASIDEVTGFLTAPVTLARVGVQYYYGYELGLKDRGFDRIGVFRSPEEVFKKDSIVTFVNLTVTDDHPSELVTVDNIKQLQMGSVSDVKADHEKGVLTGVVTVTDAQQIQKLKNGKFEVSVGYTNDLRPLAGTYNGESYEYIQTNIIANHLAIVDNGRCGPDCKIVTDNKKGGETMPVIIIDGLEYETDNKQLAQAIKNQQKAWDAEKEKMDQEEEEKEKEKEEEMKDALAQRDKALAERDAALADKLSDADISKMVHERAEVIATARTILGDKMPECDCAREIKTAVVNHVFDGADLKGKSDDYVTAMYDMAIARTKKKDDNLIRLRRDFDSGEPATITRDAARGKYIEKTLKLKGGA